MEECKRMGLKVLGPDINESLKGFAVNKKGEIRFGLGGLKGVGEAAVESIIEERKKEWSLYNPFLILSNESISERSIKKHWKAWPMQAHLIVLPNITGHNIFICLKEKPSLA